jgi:hypothetical protein
MSLYRMRVLALSLLVSTVMCMPVASVSAAVDESDTQTAQENTETQPDNTRSENTESQNTESQSETKSDHEEVVNNEENISEASETNDASQSQQNVDDQPVQAQLVQANTTAPVVKAQRCINGKLKTNLKLTWLADNSVTVTTRNGAPLCDDVTIFFSSFTLPAGYNDTGLFNDTAMPQAKYSATSAVLKKGTPGGATLTIDLPDACTDYQKDVYYGPELLVVDPNNRLGAQRRLFGKIYPNTQTDCQPVPPVTPPAGGMGGGQPEPAAPAVAQVAQPAPTAGRGGATNAAQLPAQLEDTGNNALVSIILALMLAGMATAVQFPRLLTARR